MFTYFLPSILILMKNYMKLDFVLPGSEVFINQKLFYLNVELFFKWLKKYVTPQKPKRKLDELLKGKQNYNDSTNN